MVYLDVNEEQHLKLELFNFLKKQFQGKVNKNIEVLKGFVPDYVIKKIRKKRIVLFRNPPKFPTNSSQIDDCISQGYGVYIATLYDQYSEGLFDALIDLCEKKGIGIIKCQKNKFSIIIPANMDIPSDKPDATLIPIFISSKLHTEERNIAYKRIKKLKYQPICVERIFLNGPNWDKCKEYIDKSKFFVGIVIPKYRPMVEKEIKYALKRKKGKCIIFISTKCFDKDISSKIKKLNEHVGKKVTYYRFNNCADLNNQLLKKIPQLINSSIK